MRMKVMRVYPFILNSLIAGQATAQLFYDSCSGDECRKGYIEKAEKIGEDLYLIKTIFLTYHKRGTTSADEEIRDAKIACNKARPTLIWDSGKVQTIGNRAFSMPAVKTRRRTLEPEKPETFDETTSLWKKVCTQH
jgi:hypothetical protein